MLNTSSKLDFHDKILKSLTGRLSTAKHINELFRASIFVFTKQGDILVADVTDFFINIPQKDISILLQKTTEHILALMLDEVSQVAFVFPFAYSQQNNPYPFLAIIIADEQGQSMDSSFFGVSSDKNDSGDIVGIRFSQAQTLDNNTLQHFTLLSNAIQQAVTSRHVHSLLMSQYNDYVQTKAENHNAISFESFVIDTITGNPDTKMCMASSVAIAIYWQFNMRKHSRIHRETS